MGWKGEARVRSLKWKVTSYLLCPRQGLRFVLATLPLYERQFRGFNRGYVVIETREGGVLFEILLMRDNALLRFLILELLSPRVGEIGCVK